MPNILTVRTRTDTRAKRGAGRSSRRPRTRDHSNYESLIDLRFTYHLNLGLVLPVPPWCPHPTDHSSQHTRQPAHRPTHATATERTNLPQASAASVCPSAHPRTSQLFPQPGILSPRTHSCGSLCPIKSPIKSPERKQRNFPPAFGRTQGYFVCHASGYPKLEVIRTRR